MSGSRSNLRPSGPRRSQGTALLAVSGVVLVALAALSIPAAPVMLLNWSASEPAGIYVRVDETVAPGQLIAFRTPASAFPYADQEMAYLHSRPILKTIAAGTGDAVCTRGGQLRINGRFMAGIAGKDRQRRALPRWVDCRILAADEVFVFSDRTPNSFDSRYYGPIRRSAVLGVYRPLFGRAPEPA